MTRPPAEQDALDARALAEEHRLRDAVRVALKASIARGSTRTMHPDAAHLPVPPLDAIELRKRTPPFPRRESPSAVHGVMAPHVGPAHPGTCQTQPGTTWAEGSFGRLRAFPLPALVGSVVAIGETQRWSDGLAAQLTRMFHAPFRGLSDGHGIPWKYLHIHVSVAAPPDGGEPMAVEIFGPVIAVGDVALESPEGGHFLLQRHKTRARSESLTAVVHLLPTMPGDIHVLVETATYANVCHTSFDIPSYL